jgi:hypothetical protein
VVTLQPKHVLGPLGNFSPDGNWLLLVNDDQSLAVAPARAPGPRLATPVKFFQIGFTRDSKFAYFTERAGGAGPRNNVLQAMSLPSGSLGTVSGANMWALPVRDSLLMFNDNVVVGKSSELRVADLAQPQNGSQLFASEIDWQWFFLTADRKRVVYTTQSSGHAGLYAAPAP